ncbi:hypothetical protein NB696_000439 [Xanthomonas sacchari]|nr:hypothetical protein [Xanthomonas sacchari]MCW0443567.1 hypothetical protein [Xanthomonas sacchari]
MPPSPPNPSAVSRYGASAGDTIARKTRPQCIEDIDARPTAFLVGPLQRDKTLPVTPSRLKPLLQEQWRCACMAVVVHLHDLRQAACSARDHAQRTPRDSTATCCGGPHRKVSLRLRRTAAVAACPVRAETASAATITINASRLKPLTQESEVVRCRCHVGRMDSRRSGTCCCSGSAATFGPATRRGGSRSNRKGNAARCGCHVVTMDSRRSSVCRCAGSAASLRQPRVAAA